MSEPLRGFTPIYAARNKSKLKVQFLLTIVNGKQMAKNFQLLVHFFYHDREVCHRVLDLSVHFEVPFHTRLWIASVHFRKFQSIWFVLRVRRVCVQQPRKILHHWFDVFYSFFRSYGIVFKCYLCSGAKPGIGVLWRISVNLNILLVFLMSKTVTYSPPRYSIIAVIR